MLHPGGDFWLLEVSLGWLGLLLQDNPNGTTWTCVSHISAASLYWSMQADHAREGNLDMVYTIPPTVGPNPPPNVFPSCPLYPWARISFLVGSQWLLVPAGRPQPSYQCTWALCFMVLLQQWKPLIGLRNETLNEQWAFMMGKCLSVGFNTFPQDPTFFAILKWLQFGDYYFLPYLFFTLALAINSFSSCHHCRVKPAETPECPKIDNMCLPALLLGLSLIRERKCLGLTEAKKLEGNNFWNR